MTGVRLPTHQIKGLSVTIFLQKRGSLSDRSEKGGSLGVKLQKIWAILTIFKEIFAKFAKFSKIWWYRWKFLIETAKIGVIGCRVVKKGGIRCTSDAEKVVYWQAHDAYRPMGVPPPPGLKVYFFHQYSPILEHFWCISIVQKCDIYIL